MENFNNNQQYERAKERVKEIKEFYSHLISFICVNGFLVFINLKYSEDHLWFYWPMLGWGIGLLFHGLKAFDLALLGKDWEEKKIREFMDKEKNNKSKFE